MGKKGDISRETVVFALVMVVLVSVISTWVLLDTTSTTVNSISAGNTQGRLQIEVLNKRDLGLVILDGQVTVGIR